MLTTQNRRQKVFNRGVLRICGGALCLCGGAWNSKNWQKINWFIVFHVLIWGGLELCLGRLSPPNAPVVMGVLLPQLEVHRASLTICCHDKLYTITTKSWKSARKFRNRTLQKKEWTWVNCKIILAWNQKCELALVQCECHTGKYNCRCKN